MPGVTQPVAQPVPSPAAGPAAARAVPPAQVRRSADPDATLEDFLAWVAASGLTLYPHQESAILEVFAGNHVVLDSPTGSGKSLVAQALHWKSLAEGGRTWYTAPVKALVSEKFFHLCGIFGAANVGMLTGDASVNRDAPLVCCTQEILANLALRDGASAGIASVVMDEFHYYADRDRGTAWQIPLLVLPDTAFLLMSATLGDTEAISDDLERRTGRNVASVRGVVRPVPLEFEYSTRPIHETIAELLKRDRAPIYVVHFTQNEAADQAQALLSVEICDKGAKRALLDAVRGFRFASPFGPTLRRFVLHGIGLHHAGLLPRYRRLVERLAQQGLLRVVCGTDTLGVGINVPIRTVLFTRLCKFDGEKVDILKVRDFKQIAGRAGRAGYDVLGTVVAQAPEHIVENLRLESRAFGDPVRKKRIRKVPAPTKGYKHWDESTFRQLAERPPERLESRFSIDHGRLLMLMQNAQDRGRDAGAGYAALLDLVDRSHTSPAKKERLRRHAADLLGSLEQAGIVERDGDRLALAPGLQRDFSLNHCLSLLLACALDRLDPKASGHETAVLGWVEAILEQPRAVLWKQQDQARLARLLELKAEGVPYEERQALLEEITWPKPGQEEIYSFFDEYRATHPWLGGEDVHPKGVVRAMLESWSSFGDFTKDLKLERAEGVLLRYLSDVYRTLVQNVPERHHTDEVLQIAAWLRAMLAVVDSSLVSEWEAMRLGVDASEGGRPERVDVSADRRLFAARVRAELHAVVRALSLRDWAEAAGCLRRAEDGPCGPEEIESALQPFLAEHGDIACDHDARLPTRTILRATGPHQWEVRQLLLARAPQAAIDHGFESEDDDGGEPAAWALDGRIDLRADSNPDGPLVEPVAIGP